MATEISCSKRKIIVGHIRLHRANRHRETAVERRWRSRTAPSAEDNIFIIIIIFYAPKEGKLFPLPFNFAV